MPRKPKADKVFVLEDGVHSPLGPSAAKRWLNCPGSVLLTMDMPDKDSEYSLLGTAGHTVTEWARMEGKDAKAYLGRKVEVPMAQGGSKIIVVDQEMVDATNAFSEYTDGLGGEMLCEVQVCYDGWVDNAFGTADDIRLQDGIIPITDYKYGEGVKVYAPQNEQLMLYGLGVYQDYGHLYSIDGFRLSIFQPRLDHIDEWEIPIEDLLVWANTVAQPGGKRALEAGAPFKAGEWCQFCKAKGRCKTRASYMTDVVYGSDFDDTDFAAKPKARNINLLSNDEIGLLLPMVDVIKSFSTDLEAHAYAAIGKGEVITHPVTGDYKLVAGRSNRVWGKEEEEVVKIITEQTDIEADTLYTKKLVGPSPIEKILGKKHELMQGDNSIVKKPQGKPKLVPGTDKRAALEVNAEEEFEDFD